MLLQLGIVLQHDAKVLNSFKLCQKRASDTDRLIGAVSEARTLVIFHDNMSDTRDTNQAINGSVSIFLRVLSFELVMQQFWPVLWLFSIAYVS